MITAKKYPAWTFPSNGGGQIIGINDGGVETFKGTPLKSLAREICQNSLDAALPNSSPVKVEFQTFQIPASDVPGFQDLLKVFKACQEFWKTQKRDKKAQSFFSKGIDLLSGKSITCLRISDHNTTGLMGADKDNYGSPWNYLIKSSGASDKGGSNGGSFGIGKFAPFACSNLRTVFYSTRDMKGIKAYQGVARLTSFQQGKDSVAAGIGFYGAKKSRPVFDQISLQKGFCRKPEDSGTDVYIIGFQDDENWIPVMVSSVLDSFLYAVYEEKLAVRINEVEICKETLPDLMQQYKDSFRENADEYYAALTADPETSQFVRKFDVRGITGELVLNLIIHEGFHRKVAMVRETGMKIMDQNRINGLIPFSGLLYIKGDSLNSYLRGIENPQHLKWEVDRADNKTKAQKVLREMLSFIKETFNNVRNEEAEEELDPSVGEYLAFQEESGQSSVQKQEGLTDQIQEIVVRERTVGKPAGSGSGSDYVLDDDPEDVPADEEGFGMGGSESTGGSGAGGSSSGGDSGSGGSGTGSGGGSSGSGGNNGGSGSSGNSGGLPQHILKGVHGRFRIICQNKDKGEYLIILSPNENAEKGRIDLFMIAESQSYPAELISAVSSSGENLKTSENHVYGLSFAANEQQRIRIKINYHDYCSMEVKAYGNKA